jgi:hypothetical protein
MYLEHVNFEPTVVCPLAEFLYISVLCGVANSSVADPGYADPGCLSRILIFDHPRSRIPDPKTATKDKTKTNFTKL